jgi:hypothetical protein
MVHIKKILKDKMKIFNSSYQYHNFDIKKINKYFKKKKEEECILDVSCYNGKSYPLDPSLTEKYDLELQYIFDINNQKLNLLL